MKRFALTMIFATAAFAVQPFCPAGSLPNGKCCTPQICCNPGQYCPINPALNLYQTGLVQAR